MIGAVMKNKCKQKLLTENKQLRAIEKDLKNLMNAEVGKFINKVVGSGKKW